MFLIPMKHFSQHAIEDKNVVILQKVRKKKFYRYGKKSFFFDTAAVLLMNILPAMVSQL